MNAEAHDSWHYSIVGEPGGGSVGLGSGPMTALEFAEYMQERHPGKIINVWPTPLNDGYPQARDQLKELILSERPDLSAESLAELDYFILPDSCNKYRRGAYLLTLAEFKANRDAYHDDDPEKSYDYDNEIDDFVYFRRWGKVLCNVGRHTSHEIFLGHWVAILNHLVDGKALPKRKDIRDVAENADGSDFLTQGHGMYLSRAWGCSTIHASAEHPLNFQEKKVFGDRIRYHEKD